MLVPWLCLNPDKKTIKVMEQGLDESHPGFNLYLLPGTDTNS